MTRRHGIFLAVFVVLVAGLSTWRVQVQEHEIRSAAWYACQGRNDNIVRATQLYQGLIAIERANPVAAQSTIDQRIDLYTRAIPRPAKCGEKP